jgi:DNA repair photolyase
MKKYSGHAEPWGSFVDAKVNIVEVLAREVRRRRPGRVVVGSVCDSYQPAEAHFRLTRGVVELLARHQFPFRVLTKSSLVTRDIDLFRRAADCAVSVTITTLDEPSVSW